MDCILKVFDYFADLSGLQLSRQNTIIQEYGYGGFKMIDFTEFS